jgi:SagB-type dehydrogenase family enzyme
MELLASVPEAAAATRRAVRRHPHRRALPLPPPELPATPFAEVVAARRSARHFAGDAVALAQLSALLQAAYGQTHAPEGARVDEAFLRAVPSGGALYPLELYVAALDVCGVRAGLYHYDPLAHALEPLCESRLEALADALVFRDLLEGCALVVVVTAVFWRTRFKYGLRGYRFALIESGHVAQNLLLAATALGLASVPIGGFYDRPLDDFLLVDGVDESALYGIFVGGAAR